MGGQQGVSHSVNTRMLTNGWYMGYETIQPIVPAYKAVVGLDDFYEQIMTSAGDQLANGTHELANVAFTGGGFSLQLASLDPIDWDWIINFVGDMIDNMSNDFAVLFKGTASSCLWEAAAVTASLALI